MKKKLSFLIVALMAMVSFAWADPLVESSGNQGSADTKISGMSYTLDGTFIAGKGGVQQGNMPDKGVKMRTNKGPVVFKVNKGFKITKLEFWGCGNTSTAVDIVSVTVDGGEQNLLANTVTLPGKADGGASGDFVLSDIAAEDNITLTFKDGTSAQFVGTWKITYEQTEVIVQEITGVTLNGTPISENDLAQLKANKTVTIDGSTLNGAGAVDVTLSSGSTTVAKTFENSTAVYTFKVDNDEYKIYVRGVAKTYTEEGTVVAYSANGTDATGANTKTITMNGISFSMVADKTFQYGSGNVTLGENVYVPLKLSTGSAVNVTFPDGKKATKVTVYGWSANGNGKLNAMKESAESEKSVDVSNDVYYATNTGVDIYPSVYEYNLDNWESLYFNPGGSPSQPFVVMDFTFAEEQSETKTYAIVGDFTGGWPAETGDDGSKDAEMTADPTAEGIYTLTVEGFEAEAKKYEYKLRANKQWGVYELPANGNQDFVFGSNEYPAGKYNLTFTADVNKHVLTLDVVKAEEPVPTKYNVLVDDGQVFGTVEADKYEAAENDQVALKVSVKQEYQDTYELDALTVTGVDGSPIETHEIVGSDYNYAFTMPAQNVTVSATFKEIPQLVGYFVVGNMNEWGYDEAYQMTPDNDNLYKLTKEFKANDELKVKSMMSDKSFTWYPDNMDNFVIPQDGEYTITFNPAGGVEDWYGGFFNVVMKEEPIVVNTYTATVTNDAAWNAVYAYAWTKDAASGTVKEFLGEWPGTPIRPTEAGDFILSFQAEEAPDSIIFNNGSGEQTADLAFENGGTYTNAKPEVQKYNVILYDGMVNGTVDADKFEAAEGDQVLLLVTPNDGFDLDQLTVATQDGAPIETQPMVGGDYNYAFVMPGGDVYVSATFKEKAQPTIDPLVYNIADDSWTVTNGVLTDGTVNFTGEGPDNFKKNSGYFMFGKSGAYINFPIYDFDVEKIVVEGRNGASGSTVMNIYVGENEASDATTGSTGTNTYKIAEAYQAAGTQYTLKISSSHNGQITKITVYPKNGDTPQPGVEIKSMAIVGDFLGLEATGESNDPNWDPANGWEMTQSTDNPAIWTYVKEGFVAEAKKYEYKATANGKWGDYELPAEGNQDFVFGTDMYPAGTYNLTFTANTSTHELTLDVAKDGISTVRELNAQPNGTEFKFLGDAIVVATPAKGQAKYVYIKDATGNSLIYDKSGELTADIAVGNVITAPWEGTVSIYKSLFEAIPTAALGATSTVQVVIPEGYPEDVVADSVNKVMEIKGLSIESVDDKGNIKFTIGNAAVVGYNQFGIELPADYEGKTFDVVGAVGRYNDNAQFQPITITEVVAPVEDVYSVAGSSEALFGTTWNQKEGNEMTLTEGKYTWTKEKVALPAGDVKFKVVKNHSWDESWPNDDYVLNIPETAEYTVTITFDEETKAITAEATKTGEAQVDDVVVLAGVEAICGSNWNDKDEANKMTESPTAVGLYTITKENLTLNAGTYEYKVVLNGTWYPERDNAKVVIENAGIYSIEFTFNKETKETNAIATKTGDPVDEKDFSVSFTTDKEWKQVYAYIWNSSIQAPNPWPGVEITETKDGDTYYYAFQSTYAPDFIIFNNGTEAEVKEQTADLPFVDGMIYSLTTEKTTAWAGDPEEAIPATTGIKIESTTCKDAGVQAEKIIRIVAKELAIAAPARGLDNTVTGDPNDIPFSIVKADGETELIADKDITVAEDLGEKGKAYEFTATASVAEEITKDGFIIKPKTEKNVAVASIEVEQAKAPEPGTFSEKIAAALAAGTGEVTVTMEQDETLDAAINVPLGKQLVLDGANKTLTLGAETNFVLNDNITLKNVKIDATELTKPLIALTADPAEGTKKNQDVYTDANAQDFNLLNAVTVEGAMVKNLKTQFISSNGADWALENFTLTKSIIQLDATGKNFIAFDATANNKGAIKNITISENTIYNINETSNAYFIRFANSSNAAKAFGTNNGTSTFDYKLTKNTIINTFKAQNFGNNTPNNPKTTIEATQNIYVDLKQPSKFIQGNCTKTVEKNVSWGGTEEATMSEHIDPAFTVPTTALDLTAENGGIDLKIDALSKAAEYQAGDPRWVVPAVGYYLAGNMNDWKPLAEYKLTANTAAEGVEYMITVDLAADAQFKIAKSDGTTIDDANYYPSGMGNAYGENGELQGAGKYTVYFRPNADGGDDWFYHVIFAQKFYNITVVNCDGMTITPEVTEATAGTKVWATVAMTEGYEPEFPGFTNTDTGDVIAMTEGTDVGMDEETGKVWIIMPAQNLTITAKAAKVSLITLDLSQENGSATCISVNKEDPASFYKKEGKEIYLTVTPDAGYTADITVTAGEDPVEVIAEAGTYHEQAYTHKFIMPAKDVTVKVTFTKSTGINGIDADDADDNAPIYNLAGQKVDKNYKGVVIKNGKKIYQK